MKLTLILFFLASPFLSGCARPVHAQLTTPQQFYVQSKACERDSLGHVTSCAFDNPVRQGNMIISTVLGGCSVALNTCNTVSDTQRNTWQTALAVPNFNGFILSYATVPYDGPDTVDFASGWLAIIAEYRCPYGCVLEDANYGTYAAQNVHAPQGASYDDHHTEPVETEESCELLIGWDFLGSVGGPWVPSAGPGFTLRNHEYGAIALEDAVTTIPGLYMGTMKWNAAAHWDMGVAAFKMGGCH